METKFRRPYDVDILIRGYNNIPLLRRLLRSIFEHTDPARFQVTYVDNGSSPYDVGQLVNDYPALQIVRLPFNHGSVRAINIGLSMALMSPSKFVVLMDNDTEIPKGDKTWLDRFIACFDDENVAYAGAVSDYVAGYQQVEVIMDTYTRDWKNEQGEGQKAALDVPLMVSFCMMLRKSALIKTGLFDERFEPGMAEDYDMCLRLRECGYSGLVAQSVYIHHKGSQTFDSMGFTNLLNINMGKLIEKYGADRLNKLGVLIAKTEAPVPVLEYSGIKAEEVAA